MIITDTSKNPVLNNSINLKKLADCADGRTDCVQILATGTVSAGEVKLTVSQDDVDFYPLTGDDGAQLTLHPGEPVYVKFANLFIKCDLTGVTCDNLKVQAQ